MRDTREWRLEGRRGRGVLALVVFGWCAGSGLHGEAVGDKVRSMEERVEGSLTEFGKVGSREALQPGIDGLGAAIFDEGTRSSADARARIMACAVRLWSAAEAARPIGGRYPEYGPEMKRLMDASGGGAAAERALREFKEKIRLDMAMRGQAMAVEYGLDVLHDKAYGSGEEGMGQFLADLEKAWGGRPGFANCASNLCQRAEMRRIRDEAGPGAWIPFGGSHPTPPGAADGRGGPVVTEDLRAPDREIGEIRPGSHGGVKSARWQQTGMGLVVIGSVVSLVLGFALGRWRARVSGK